MLLFLSLLQSPSNWNLPIPNDICPYLIKKKKKNSCATFIVYGDPLGTYREKEYIFAHNINFLLDSLSKLQK